MSKNRHDIDVYDQVSQDTATLIMKHYSTSFGLASRLFPKAIRQHIYNIYGLVRIADEIVDTYQGNDQLQRLDELEHEVNRSLLTGYSSNPVVQAFQMTALKCHITTELSKPFFDSMRMDCQQLTYDQDLYNRYIYGSAEVIGLMCLQIFDTDNSDEDIKTGARHLGAAFQKINFLRDIADDYSQRGRYYFPVGSFENFDDDIKSQIVTDIKHDLEQSLPAIWKLPPSVRPAVLTAYDYYGLLLKKLTTTPADDLKLQRLRIADTTKLWLLARRIAIRRTF